MGNMMRRGRVNPNCKCCNISDDPGWRTREKNEWKKQLEEEMTDNFGLLNNREQIFIDAFKEGIRKEERERITKILLQRLEYFDCDICGECVTPTRLVEMITEK